MISNELIRKQLLTADTGVRQLTKIEAHEIHFAPGQTGALHYHPCPVTGYIIKGTALVEVEGQPAQILHAGEAFFEPALTRILHFDNYSTTEPMVFIAFYLLDGRQTLIELITE
jgi:quercetin dioxygenase-like cupin family protein